ncbi:hypothetical protein [Silicimonas algicola]|nr:hypothetical protein [Silicimonas algicola]
MILTYPTALLGSLYLSAFGGLDSSEAFAAYALLGALTMAALTLVNGTRPEGSR